jgi:RNA polymerase sigma-70 factor (ECF subfamily)
MQPFQLDSHSATPLGDSRDGFEAVVVPLIGDTYRTALRFARQPDDANDLAQEALLRALRGFRHFVPGTNARAWLRTIVHSVFLTRHRARRRQPEFGIFDPDHLSDETRTGWFVSIEDARDARDTGAEAISDPRIRRAMDCLPRTFRAAVWLVDVDELTYEEAAAALQCPLNTLRSRLFRGRRQLAQLLRGPCEPDRDQSAEKDLKR